MYLHKTKNGHYTPPCCYFSGELEVVESVVGAGSVVTRSMIGFAKIIQEETEKCDILYRLDERLSVPECDYFDYTGVGFAKFYGPQFEFDGRNLEADKTIIVHIDETTQDKASGA